MLLVCKPCTQMFAHISEAPIGGRCQKVASAAEETVHQLLSFSSWRTGRGLFLQTFTLYTGAKPHEHSKQVNKTAHTHKRKQLPTCASLQRRLLRHILHLLGPGPFLGLTLLPILPLLSSTLLTLKLLPQGLFSAWGYWGWSCWRWWGRSRRRAGSPWGRLERALLRTNGASHQISNHIHIRGIHSDVASGDNTASNKEISKDHEDIWIAPIKLQPKARAILCGRSNLPGKKSE